MMKSSEAISRKGKQTRGNGWRKSRNIFATVNTDNCVSQPNMLYTHKFMDETRMPALIQKEQLSDLRSHTSLGRQ